MADSVKIRIEGDDAAFESSLKQAEASAKQAAAALSAEYKKAGMDMSSAMQKAWSEVKAAQQSGSTVMISGVETTIRKNTELANSIKTVGGNGYAPLAESANQASRSITDGLDKAERKTSTFATGLQKAGSVAKAAIQGITVAVTAISGAASVAGVAVLRTGSSFTASMSEVQAISGASAEEFALLEQTAKDFGASTSFSASQAADALKYMALAGWDAQKSVDALPGVLNLAAASGMELGAASDMVTDYLSAFDMEASKAGYFSDLLAHAQSSSNTTAAALGEAFRNCAANLSAAGQDVETVTSALMGMANQGLKGSIAGTALSAMMRDIGNKMEDGAIKIGETSVAVKDAQGNYRDLTEILTDVSGAVQGMGTAERTAALSNTFTADSMRAVNLLLNEGIDNIAAYEEGLRGASGAAEDMAGTMMDNLQGDVTMFKSALEGLEITAFEGMEGPARSMVQMATDAIGQMNTAYQKNGMDGLVNNISSQIPKLTALGADAASRLMSGVAKKLPGMVKNLLSALPSVLGSAIDLAPQLADSLFSLMSTAIETLISQLPTLAPMIGKGLLNMLTSAASGLGNLVSGVFSGIWTAMGDLGLRDLTLEESIQRQIDGLDMDKVHDLGEGLLTYSFDTEIDPGDYQTEIDAAVQTIHEALLNIPGLDESQCAAIEEAILKGSGADALKAALEALDIPDPDGTATKLTSALSTITGALDSVNLSDDAKQKIKEVAAAGSDIQGALEELGVDPAKAEEVAGKITGAVTQINSACAGLDIDTSSLVLNAGSDKEQIEAALKLLGLGDVDIDSILGNLDTVSGKLSAVYKDLFTDIGDALTNGIDDANDADLDAAKQAVEDYIQDAHDKLVEWRDAKLQELEESGLTGDAYNTEVANVIGTYETMSGKIDELGAQTAQFIDDNAGKSTASVREHLGQLEELAGQAQSINAQIDSMVSGALNSQQSKHRSAVEQGFVADQEGQIEAINYTSQELEHTLGQAAETAATAYDNAEKQLAEGQISYEEYQSERLRIAGEKMDADTAAYETYNQHMARILAGIVKANPELEQALASFGDQQKLTGMAQKLQDGIVDAASSGEPIDATELIKNLGFTDVDMGALAEALQMDPAELIDGINQSLKSGLVNGSGNSPLEGELAEYIADGIKGTDLSTALSKGDIDISPITEILAAGIENGFITEDMIPGGMDGLETFVNNMIMGLNWDEEDHVITPPLTVEPQPEAAPDTQEKIEDTVEEAASETGEPATAEPDIDVKPNISPAEGTSEQIAEEVEKSTQESGETTTVEPEIDVKPDVKPAEGTQEKVAEAAGEVAGEQAPPIEMTMDVNASVGNITFTEGGGIAEKLTALFSEQSVPVTVNVNASIGEVTTGEGAGIQEAVAASLQAQPVSVSVNASADVNISVGSSNASAIGQGAGQEVSAGIASGISSGTGQVQSAARNVVNSGAITARGAANLARSAGLNFSNGLAAGIRSGQSSITAAARAVAAAAAAAARSALSIHSPSKVTEELGRFFDMGFVRGMDRHTPLVSKSAANVAQVAASAIDGIVGAANFNPRFNSGAFLNDLSGTLTDATQDFAAAESGRPIVLSVNGRELGRVMATDNAQALGERSRKKAVGLGVR